ncbi:MAG: toprim domain-containing protein [Clostridia bacterium]|nr:toprim domain-containing protein [Clostridia bacterium]
MQKDEIIRTIKTQSPDAFLQKARKRGWICPECHNGEGKDGDGIVLNKKNSTYKCFRCGFNGDILDLIGKTFNLPDFKDQLHKAVEIYGLTQISSLSMQQQAVNIIKNIGISQSSADMSDYFAKCHTALKDTSYFTGRGISQELLDRFNIGYDASFTDNGKLKKPMQAVIFPTSAQTYEARNIAIMPGSSGFRYYKHGSASLFNGSALEQEKEKPVFIVEGIIDALSVMQAGGQAIGLSSADNYRLLLTELDKIVPAKPLILCFDNDDTGADFQQKLADELDKRHISFLQATKDIIGDYHDPNDRLVKDADGLKNAVISLHERAAAMPDTAEKAKSDYLKTSAGKSLTALLDTIAANAKKPRFSTGFKTIDDALNGGLYTGLYFIGAISSLGKTTLTLQIADNLAKQGRDVLFFSLEQSKYDLMTKSISRETFLYCHKHGLGSSNAKSNLDIMDGRRWADFSDTENEVVQAAFRAYEESAAHIFIHEGIGNISVEEIREKVKNHISLTGNKYPIVFIDYLQILKAPLGEEKSTDKQVVDHNVTALKQLSRDFDIPVFAVSSLNRENYRHKINMAAFKESGAIEYGSDILIGLQLTGTGSDGFDADKAKEKNPKEIDFCILKNRNGNIKSDGIPLIFHSEFNCFTENNGTFIPITKEIEDMLPFDD